MTDDDLRFGDISGSSNTSMFDSLIELLKILVAIYVLLRVVEILFNIPIPLI